MCAMLGMILIRSSLAGHLIGLRFERCVGPMLPAWVISRSSQADWVAR